MEDDIIYLEADEEITSVVDRLRKAQGKDLILVVPRGALVLQSLVNLKLLKREATAQKKSIGVVTSDLVGRNLIVQAGIAVYESIQNKRVIAEPKIGEAPIMAQEFDLSQDKQKAAVKVHHFQTEPAPEFAKREVSNEPMVTDHKPLSKFEPAVGSPKKTRRKLIFAILAVVVFVIGSVLWLPSAKIILTVHGEPYERDLEFSVKTSESVPSIETAVIPGEFVEGEVTKSQRFTSSGKKNVGEKAKGVATISNDAGIDQTLAIGTKLTGGGLQFLTTADATVPKATLNDSGDKVAGTANVDVEALDAGEKYNVGNLSVSVPKDKLSGKINSTSGGSTREITVVSPEDIAAAKAELEKQALSDLKTELAKKSGGIIMDGAIKLEIKEQKTSVAEGSEASDFELTLKVSGKAISFKEIVFRETFIAVLRQSLPAQKTLELTSNDEILTQVIDADFTSGQMTVKGVIKTKLIPELSTGIMKKDLVAKTPAQALELVRKNTNVVDAQITRHSTWFGRMPLVAARITISVEHD